MEEIIQILQKEIKSIGDLLFCFEQIKNRGDVVVIKLDGERIESQYTVFVSFPKDESKPMIREDGINLKDTLLSVLIKYTKLG